MEKFVTKNLKIVMLVAVVIIIVSASFILKAKEARIVEKPKEVGPYLNSKIEVKTFENESTDKKVTTKDWGYDILIDGNTYVHQPSIPAVGGNRGFKTSADAQKVGELVVSKIRNNTLPPSVDPTELKNLGIE